MPTTPTIQPFDRLWPRVLRVTGLGLALYEVLVDRMAHPEVLLLAGPMMGLPSLFKEGA